MSTKELRPPYESNKATLPSEETYNAENYWGQRECTNAQVLVVFSRASRGRARLGKYELMPYDGMIQAVIVRWWMGRSSSASVVYCSVWVRGNNGKSYAGTGQAGGYGYHKESAAFDSAVRSAGIELAASVSGCGDSAIRHAMEAIAFASGYSRRAPRIFV